MQHIVVTGGAGFIGSNLTKELLAEGHNVHVIDDFSVGKRTNLPTHKRLTVSKTDITKTNLLPLFTKGTIIYHLATQCLRTSLRHPQLVHQVNTTGTLNILETALVKRAKRVVYVSSSEVYGTAQSTPMKETHLLNPETIYAASKLAGEFYSLAYLRTHGLPVVIARPFNTYGYNAHFEGPYGEVMPRFLLRALFNKPLHIFGDGKQTRDFTFVTDTVHGIMNVGTKGKTGEIYNIARGKRVSINDLAHLTIKLTASRSSIAYLPKRPGDVFTHHAAIAKAKKELGFAPKISLSKGLRQYLAWINKTVPDLKKLADTYEKTNW